MPPLPRPRFLPFTEARCIVRALKFPNYGAFLLWVRRESLSRTGGRGRIPSNPHQVYAAEWQGCSDWIGSVTVAYYNRIFLPHAQARLFVHRLKLRNSKEWYAYCGGAFPDLPPRPPDIPAKPSLTYRAKGWGGFRDWLGTGEPVNSAGSKKRPFAKARAFARSLHLSGKAEWLDYVRNRRKGLRRKPADIPAFPCAAYRVEGWKGYGDFLGTRSVANVRKKFRDFPSARAFARSLAIRSPREWWIWAKSSSRPPDIPANPSKHYALDWQGWADWHG